MSRFFRRAGDSDSDSSSSDEESLISQSDSDDEKKKKTTATPSASTSAAKPASGSMRNRFLKGAASDDSSSDDDDEDSDEDPDKEDTKGATGGAASKKARDKFLKGAASESDSDTDEEDEGGDVGKHVPKSARDKRIAELESAGGLIEQKIKINDWGAINTEFDKLVRLVQRQTALSGTTVEPTPPIFFRVISTLDSVFTQDKENTARGEAAPVPLKKKLDANKARALNTLKHKVKKTIKDYEGEWKEFTEDREKYEKKWVDATTVVVEPSVTKPKKKGDDEEEEDEEEGDENDAFTTVGKGGKQYGVGAADIYKTLAAIQEARGKKGTDRNEAVRVLEQLLRVAHTPYSLIRVLLALISARFDYNAAAQAFMPIDTWRSAQSELNTLLSTLLKHSHEYAVVENPTLEYDESVERRPGVAGEGEIVRVRGSVMSYVDRLDDEFTRSLQNIDPHGTEYVERLRDEKGLYEMICRAEVHFEMTGDRPSFARVLMRRLEHIYSKPTAVVTILDKSASDTLSKVYSPTFPSLLNVATPTDLVHSLCVQLYRTDEPLLRTRAMLCHVYHHAIMNNFHTARDLFLMSHLSENIQAADVGTQILFNRAVVQLGLCAFRKGLIKEAQSTLQDIFTTQRVKELLAQGLNLHQRGYNQVLTPEQERAERARQLPFHMHINTELLEAAFLVSSMLVEIPLLASIDNEEQKRKAISKPFRRLLDFADRQVFTGPPESTRDHIMQASKALQDGEWEKCRDLIQSIKIWSLMPEEAAVKEMLAKRIQEEGLRTYLFTYSSFYASLSLAQLATTFSLPVRTVTATVSKMIWNEELAASLDQSSGTVIFHRVELSRVQQLAQSLADRVSAMAEQNAKTLDSKLGGDGAAGTGAGGKGWGDRAGGGEGRKEGEQQGERRSGGQRRGGGTRGRGQRFAQGLGGRVVGAASA